MLAGVGSVAVGFAFACGGRLWRGGFWLPQLASRRRTDRPSLRRYRNAACRGRCRRRHRRLGRGCLRCDGRGFGTAAANATEVAADVSAAAPAGSPAPRPARGRRLNWDLCRLRRDVAAVLKLPCCVCGGGRSGCGGCRRRSSRRGCGRGGGRRRCGRSRRCVESVLACADAAAAVRRWPANWRRWLPRRSQAAPWPCPTRRAAAPALTGATMTGSATATGFGVVAGGAALLREHGERGRPRASSEAGLSVDLVAPAFAVPDFAPDALARYRHWRRLGVGASAGIGVGGAGRHWRRGRWNRYWRSGWRRLCPAMACCRAAAGVSSAGRCAAMAGVPPRLRDRCRCRRRVLLSTSAPKLSLPCEGSGRAGFCGAPWKDTLSLFLTSRSTRAASHNEIRNLWSARTGPSRLPKIIYIFQWLAMNPSEPGAAAANSFSARRQDLPFGPCKRGERDCLTGIRPILKSGFQPLRPIKAAF